MKTRTFHLSKGWYIAKDADNVGREEGWENRICEQAVAAHVPSVIQEFFPQYHGIAYYWCCFTPCLDTYENGKLLLHFGGVDYKADIWLNGSYLGSEEGGETPFTFDVTSRVRLGGENLLAVRVLNPCEKTIDGLNLMNTPHRNKVVKKQAGCSINQGGVWYAVDLTATPATSVADVFVNADFHTGVVLSKITVDASIQADVTLSVRIYEKSTHFPLVAEETLRVSVPVGASLHEVTTKVTDLKPWHVDDPNLYVTKVTLFTNGEEHTSSVTFGFRDFRVKDGFFYLNGEKLFIKSAHSGNAFPIGLMLPVDPDHLRRDFLYAKSCGFNMIRAIAGMFRPEQLALADEMGLLVYEECYASWCLGYSMWRTWKNEEEYQQLAELYPDILLGDEQEMLDRWRSSTEKMILRDRNHPSLVMWGLLNETKNNSVYRTARDFLPRLRELDPSRFVVLSSGRWDYDFSVGSGSNPYSLAWENTWGIDGHPEAYDTFVANGGNPAQITPDNHYYPAFPFQEKDKAVFRSYGKNALPMFISECGQGPVMNVIDELRGFRQFGARRDLEDHAWMESQAHAFEKDFERLGLNRVFAFPEHVLRASQENNAMTRRELFDVIRSNPRICGYSLTGLLDHGFCGEGLWSFWRQWKPTMFDAVSDGWAKLRFCLFVSHNRYTDEPVSFEAVLANDHVLASGRYTARFAITSHNTPVYTFNCAFDLEGDELAVPITKQTLDLHLPAGEYELCAELDEGAARANRLPFSVKERITPLTTIKRVACLGVTDATRAWLQDAGFAITQDRDEASPRVLLVGEGAADTVASAIQEAERGARVLFLDWRILQSEEALTHLKKAIPDASLFEGRDWLYHKEIILCEKEVFEGIGSGLAKGRDFTREWPKISLRTDVTPQDVIAPVFETGSYQAEGSYYLMYALAGFGFGSGTVYFNAFDLQSNLGSPTADRLLFNLLQHLF